MIKKSNPFGVPEVYKGKYIQGKTTNDIEIVRSKNKNPIKLKTQWNQSNDLENAVIAQLQTQQKTE